MSTVPDASGRERLSRRGVPGSAELEGRAYPTLTYFNEVDKGGHFAAWEQRQLFSERAPRRLPLTR